MKTKRNLLSLLLPAAIVATSAFAQQVPIPQKASEVTTAASDVLMHPEYVKTLGRMAYVWGWPMINQHNRRAAITQAPHPGLLNGVLPAAPAASWRCCMITSSRRKPSSPARIRTSSMASVSSRSMSSLSSFKSRTSATAFGSMRSMMRARSSSPKSANPTAQSPASICWSARIGKERNPRA